MKATVASRRAELVERVAECDETVGELFLMEEPVDSETLRGGIRRATLALKFVPVFMGRSVIGMCWLLYCAVLCCAAPPALCFVMIYQAMHAGLILQACCVEVSAARHHRSFPNISISCDCNTASSSLVADATADAAVHTRTHSL